MNKKILENMRMTEIKDGEDVLAYKKTKKGYVKATRDYGIGYNQALEDVKNGTN